MPEPLPEIALTEEEIDQILRSCDGRALLVGGQALAFWAEHYQVKPPGVLAVSVTSDVDFVGPAQVARDLSRSLKPMGWRYWQPSADDTTSQTAKLTKRIEGQGIKQIDFLGGIVGLKTEGIQQRATVLSLADGMRIRVLHPLDVLESRLKNLAELPSKRAPQGIAQAHLAIDVVGCFLEQLLREGPARRLLNAIDRVDRKSTRLNSSHGYISYAVFCLKNNRRPQRQDSDRRHVRRHHLSDQFAVGDHDGLRRARTVRRQLRRCDGSTGSGSGRRRRPLA